MKRIGKKWSEYYLIISQICIPTNGLFSKSTQSSYSRHKKSSLNYPSSDPLCENLALWRSSNAEKGRKKGKKRASRHNWIDLVTVVMDALLEDLKKQFKERLPWGNLSMWSLKVHNDLMTLCPT